VKLNEIQLTSLVTIRNASYRKLRPSRMPHGFFGGAGKKIDRDGQLGKGIISIGHPLSSVRWVSGYIDGRCLYKSYIQTSLC
jgi:hypothetical protein